MSYAVYVKLTFLQEYIGKSVKKNIVNVLPIIHW